MTTFGTLNKDGTLSDVRVIQSSAIAKCPHCIFVPRHYREDGTCKCDDPNDLDMKSWGYHWSKKLRRWN
jgi:hypothetical protein